MKDATQLKNLEGVANATTNWDTCDMAVLIENGADIGPARQGYTIKNIKQFNAAPYTLFELNAK